MLSTIRQWLTGNSPHLQNSRRWAVWLLPPALVLAVAGTGNNQPGKTWSNPWLGLNDDQKQATVAGAHVPERAWFDSFVKSGSDARLLPRAPIESYAASVDTLDALTSVADVIVVAKAESQTFGVDGDNSVPRSTVQLRVVHAIRGSTLGSQLTLVQTGGPVRTSISGQGALAELDGSPLIFANDVVILAARRNPQGELFAIPGLGIHFSEGDRITSSGAPSNSPLIGLSIAEAVTKISDTIR